MFLPEGYEEGTDRFKVMATVEPANFRWLLLPALDEPTVRSAEMQTRSPANPLEELMAAFSADQPRSRNARPAAFPGRRWVTEQVSVRVTSAT